jgi:predicted nucleic acid-binding protein
MLFDTDVVIWFLRQNGAAERLIDETPELAMSVITYMQVMEGARSRQEARAIRDLFGELRFAVLPLSESIGLRAAFYVEEYALHCGMDVTDAVIAATAHDYDLVFCTGNLKHYRPIRELELRPFRP